ncbi:proline dehydrogenase family protein [Jeotgalibacillus sp. ET6]|uniref:proline dehydrogenase family protein n=1 Tax=Jeotgalibacillus sp. ET6 TaxID=3037260 RepID=UPI002418A65D|nr:proline dehydrogenase family protein [Jeotgalibacillus sp. ET6]MDG5471931.1 proline dehydrogenase family protein [Jeotgalibacillus sp. ET6]
MVEETMRGFFTFLAHSKPLIKIARKSGLTLGGSHFVGGQEVEGMVDQVKEFNQKGLGVTVDCLGERIEGTEDAKETVNLCYKAIHALHENKLKGQISLKLFSVGLELSEEIAIHNMRNILEEAKKYNVFVTINMEEYKNCEKIIRVFTKLRNEYDNVGIALQANLYRTETDVEKLDALSPVIRFVKGAYKESADVDMDDKSNVDWNYQNLVKTNLLKGNYTQIATHDNDMIDFVKKTVKEHNIPLDQFEFQMLQGMRDEKQKELAEEGYNVVVYVPFGPDWYTYFMKRLAERPANVGFTVMSVFRR